MSFEFYQLSDIANIQGGFAFKGADFQAAGIAVVKIANIQPPSVSLVGVDRVQPVKLLGLDRFKLSDGDVLMAMTGATVGKVGRFKQSEPAYLNQRVARITAKRGSEYDDFIYAVVTQPGFDSLIEGASAGSAQANISTTGIGSVQIPRLESDTQLVIGKIARALDDRITLLRETNATLEAIAQALFKSWFVDFDPVHAKLEGRAPEGMDEATAALFPDGFEESELGLVPRRWRVLRLGDATERITKGTTPTTLKRPFVEAGINFVKAESMTGDGGFIPEKFAFIDSETHEILRRSQLQDADVLISIAGTIGRIAVMTNYHLPANTNQAVALIRPLQHIFPSGLINRFLRLGTSQQQMHEKVVQAVQANLSLGTLSDLKVVVPPQEVVNKLFASGLAQIDACWLANDQRVRTLATLRDTLLPRLISGQLRLPKTS